MDAYIEEIAWTCSCGTAMGLEVNGTNGTFELNCRQCGHVANLTVRVLPTRALKGGNRD